MSPEERRERNAVLDMNGDGFLDQDEVLLGLKHKNSSDTTNLPQIKDEYRRTKKLPEGLRKDPRLKLRYTDFLRKVPDLPPYALDAVEPQLFALEHEVRAGPSPADLSKQRSRSRWDVKVRRTTDDLSKPINAPYTQGALFSYSRDFRADSEALTARGVLGLSYSIVENPDRHPDEAEQKTGEGATPSPKPDDTNLVRGIDALMTFEFDELDTDQAKATGTDNLKFGAHVTTDLKTGHRRAALNEQELDAMQARGEHPKPEMMKDKYPFFKSLQIDLAAKWTTDSHFERNISDLELDLSPRFDLFGMGSERTLIGPARGQPGTRWLSFRWDVTAHAEAGTVAEAGNTPTRFNNDDFARIGGRARCDLLLLPTFLHDRLSVSANYTYYHSLNDAPSNQLFRATGQFILPIGTGVFSPGKAGDLVARDLLATLRIEYQRGRVPLTLEKDESFLLGLGVLF